MQALYAANATGLAPPVFHGNWRQAAAARLRWFDTAGGPNGARPDAWCVPAAIGQSPLACSSVPLKDYMCLNHVLERIHALLLFAGGLMQTQRRPSPSRRSSWRSKGRKQRRGGAGDGWPQTAMQSQQQMGSSPTARLCLLRGRPRQMASRQPRSSRRAVSQPRRAQQRSSQPVRAQPRSSRQRRAQPRNNQAKSSQPNPGLAAARAKQSWIPTWPGQQAIRPSRYTTAEVTLKFFLLITLVATTHTSQHRLCQEAAISEAAQRAVKRSRTDVRDTAKGGTCQIGLAMHTSFSSYFPAIRSTPPAACAGQPA